MLWFEVSRLGRNGMIEIHNYLQNETCLCIEVLLVSSQQWKTLLYMSHKLLLLSLPANLVENYNYDQLFCVICTQ